MTARTRTLAELRADVLWQADREGTSLRNASAQVNRAINQSIAEFREAVSEAGNPYYLTKSTGNLSTGPTSPYHFGILDLAALSPAHLRIYGLDVQVSQTWLSLDPVQFRERNDVQSSTVGGSAIPRQFFEFDRTSVAYAPASDTAYPYILWYLPVHSDLVADGDTFDGINGFGDDWVVFNSVARLLLRDRDAHLERFELERRRLLERVLHVSRQRQRAGAVVRGGTRADRRGPGRDLFFGGQAGDALNQPSSAEGGRMALARTDGKINWAAGDEPGSEWTWGTDGAGFSWQRRRGWIKPAIDLSGAVDATPAINAALATRDGACVYLPEGTIRCATPILSTRSNITLLGRGSFLGGTLIRPETTNASAIQMSGDCARVEGLMVQPSASSALHTAGYAIAMLGGGRTIVSNVFATGTYNGFWMTNCVEGRFEGSVSFRDLLGVDGLRFDGSGGNTGIRCIVDDFGGSNSYIGAIQAKGNWTPSTAYVVNDIVLNNGIIWQCSFAGTSAGSGGPTTIPSPLGVSRTTDVTDGTAKWRFIQRQMRAIVFEGNSASLVIRAAAVLNTWQGLFMGNDNGGAAPVYLFVDELEVDHPYDTGVWLKSGSSVYLGNKLWISSVFRGNGLVKGSGFTGDMQLNGGAIFGCYGTAAQMQSGKFRIANLTCEEYSGAGGGVGHGIDVASGISDWQLLGNHCRSSIAGGTYDIRINGTTGDNFAILGNGTRSGALLVGPSLSASKVSANNYVIV